MNRLLHAVAVLMLAGVSGLSAAPMTLNLGLVAVEDAGVGALSFSVLNLTGTPACGSPCGLSDFPVSSALTFSDLALSLTEGSGSILRQAAGIVAAGDTLTPPEFDVPAAGFYTSAILTGKLDITSILLENGKSLKLLSDVFSVIVLPSSGSFLASGDMALLLVTADVESVPEPASALLVMCGTAAIVIARRKLRA